MAWTAASVFEYRPDGPALGGGGVGFDPAFGGVDYSQQLTPVLHVTDAACAASTTISSATGGFTSQMKGNGIAVNGNLYQITAFTDSNHVVVDRTAGTFSGQSANVGGCGACKGPSTSCFEPIYYGVNVVGQKHWFKNRNAAGVLTTYAPAANMVFAAGAQYNYSDYQGYGATRGDGGQADFGATWAGFANGVNFIHARYLKIRGVQAGQVLLGGGLGQCWEDCVFDASAFTNSYCISVGSSPTALFRRCYVLGCPSGSAATLRENTGATYEECHFEGGGQLNVSIESGNTPTFLQCILNGGTFPVQINNNTAGVRLFNCVVWNSIGAGIDFPAGDLHDGENTIVKGCIIGKNATYDISHTVSNVSGNAGVQTWVDAFFRCNWFYTTGTARYRNMPGASDDHTLTANPFVDDAAGNFQLNSAAGGGALIRANPCSHTWPDALNVTSLTAGPSGIPATADAAATMEDLWREYTNEKQTDVVDDVAVFKYLDAGLEALNRRIRFHFTTDSTTIALVAGTQEYTLPTDFIEMNWVQWNGFDLEKGDINLWRRGGDTWRQEAAGQPKEWAVYGNKLVLRPAPSAEAVALQASPVFRYLSKPASVTEGVEQLSSQDWRVAVYFGVAEYSGVHPDSPLHQARASQMMEEFNAEVQMIAGDYKARELQKK